MITLLFLFFLSNCNQTLLLIVTVPRFLNKGRSDQCNAVFSTPFICVGGDIYLRTAIF